MAMFSNAVASLMLVTSMTSLRSFPVALATREILDILDA